MFHVEEFPHPLLKGSIRPVRPALVGVSEAELDLQFLCLSGGGASAFPVKLRAMVDPRYVAERLWRPLLRYQRGRGARPYGRVRRKRPVFQQPFPARTSPWEPAAPCGRRSTASVIAAAPGPCSPKSNFRDPTVNAAISRSLPLWPAGLLLGVKPDNSASVKDNFISPWPPSTLRPADVRMASMNRFQRKRCSSPPSYRAGSIPMSTTARSSRSAA